MTQDPGVSCAKTTTTSGSWGSSEFSEAVVMVSKAWVFLGIPWHQDLGLGDPFSESEKMREKNTEARVLAWEGVAVACARGPGYSSSTVYGSD